MRPHRSQPTRLPHPWDSPGKNTGVGCHFLLQCMKVKSESEVAQSCPALSDPMDCSLPGSSVHGIFSGKSTGVGCHCLLQYICSLIPIYYFILRARGFSKALISSPTTCKPMCLINLTQLGQCTCDYVHIYISYTQCVYMYTVYHTGYHTESLINMHLSFLSSIRRPLLPASGGTPKHAGQAVF